MNKINKLLEEIKNNYKSNTILLVTHSGTARAIEAYFYGTDKDGELPPENLRNCEMECVTLTSNNLQKGLKIKNYCYH